MNSEGDLKRWADSIKNKLIIDDEKKLYNTIRSKIDLEVANNWNGGTISLNLNMTKELRENLDKLLDKFKQKTDNLFHIHISKEYTFSYNTEEKYRYCILNICVNRIKI